MTLLAAAWSATPRRSWSRNEALTSGAEEDSPMTEEIDSMIFSTSLNAKDVLYGFRILGADHDTGHKRLRPTCGAPHQPK